MCKQEKNMKKTRWLKIIQKSLIFEIFWVIFTHCVRWGLFFVKMTDAMKLATTKQILFCSHDLLPQYY